MRKMPILCCDARTARLGALTALIFFAALYLLSSHLPQTWTQLTKPALTLKSWSNTQVTTPGEPVWPYRTFKSSPWKPPHVNITRYHGDLAEGYLLLTAKNRGKEGLIQSAPWILDDGGELVYAHDAEFGVNNFRVQEYKGAEYLTVWQGESTIGHGYGELVMLDGGYQQKRLNLKLDTFDMGKIASRGPPGLIDFHEQEFTSSGTVYVTAYNNTPADLTSIGGQEDGWVLDSLICEIDIQSEEVLFTWSALEHISLGASHLGLETYMGQGINGAAWDHFHLNSIQEVGDYLLVSSRHAFAVYLIDRRTGEIEWELSGRDEGGYFGALGEYGQFSWQHDARAHNVTEDSMTISLFDNHVMPETGTSTPTRGLLLHISLPPDPSKPPTVLRDVHTHEVIYSPSQGSYDPALANGNQLLCYGPSPVAREFGPDGDLRWEGRFGADDAVQSYRAFKQTWRGTPKDWDPRLHVEVVEKGSGEGDQLELYVSWNGATDVTDWNIYTKNEEASQWSQLGTAKRIGFETVTRIGGGNGDCVVLAAVEGGREVRRSNEVCI